MAFCGVGAKTGNIGRGGGASQPAVGRGANPGDELRPERVGAMGCDVVKKTDIAIYYNIFVEILPCASDKSG